MWDKHIDDNKVYIFLAIWLVALLMRMATVASMPQPDAINGDAHKYMMMGVNIAKHGVYTYQVKPPFETNTVTPPGYPVLQALMVATTKGFHEFVSASQIMNIIVGASSCAMIFLIGVEIGFPIAGILGSFLYVFSPHANVFSYFLLTETVFIFWLCLSIFFICRHIKSRKPIDLYLFIIFSVIAGLTRPAYLLFPFACFFFMAILEHRDHGWRRYLIPAFSYLLLMSIWPVTAHIYAGKDQPSLAGSAIYLGSYPHMEYDGKASKTPYEHDPNWQAAVHSPGKAVELIWDKAKREPAKYLSWYLLGKPVFYWRWDLFVGYGGPFVYPVEKSLFHPGHWGHNLIKAYRAIHPGLVIVALLSPLFLFFIKPRESRAAVIVIWSLLAYYTLVHMALAPLPRYSVTMYEMVYLLFFVSIMAILRHAQLFGLTYEKSGEGHDLPH